MDAERIVISVEEMEGSEPLPPDGNAGPLSTPERLTIPGPVAEKQRRPKRKRRLVLTLASVCLIAWTAAAFTYGLTVGTRRRVEPPSPPAAIVVNVEEASVPDSVAAPAADTVAVVEMSNVIGLSEADALAVLGGSGIDPALITSTPVGTAGDAGLVIAQDPPPGSFSPAAVTLSVSAAVDIPAVVGTAASEAVSMLEELGAVVQFGSRYEPGVGVGTVLEADPTSGPLPAIVSLTVSEAPASIDLAPLRAVSAEGCTRNNEVNVNGVTGQSSFECELRATPADGTPRTYTLDYDLGRKVDELSFTLGFTDDSEIDASATVDIVIDNVVVATHSVAFGQPVDVVLPVNDALRLQFVAHAVVDPLERTRSGSYGTVAAIGGVLLGSKDDIAILAETIS